MVLSDSIERWLVSSGYRLPRRTHRHPNPLPHWVWAGRSLTPRGISAIRRIVFFGRLEPRKGLALFCDAIDELEESFAGDYQLALLGRVGNAAIEEYINIRK